MYLAKIEQSCNKLRLSEYQPTRNLIDAVCAPSLLTDEKFMAANSEPVGLLEASRFLMRIFSLREIRYRNSDTLPRTTIIIGMREVGNARLLQKFDEFSRLVRYD